MVKRLTHQGSIRFKDKVFFITQTLKLLDIGLEETDDAVGSLYFNNLLLGKIDERDMVFRG